MALTAPPLAVGEALFTVEGRQMSKLNLHTGDLLWSTDVDDDLLLVRASDAGVLGLANGELTFVQTSSGAVGLHRGEPDGLASVELVGEELYLSQEAGWVERIEASTGNPVWSTSVEYGGGDIAVVEGSVIVNSEEGALVALARETGDLQWRIELEIDDPVGPLRGPNAAIVQSATGSWYGVDASGEVLWSGEAPAQVSLKDVVRGTVIASDAATGTLVGIEARTGAPAWELSLPGIVQTMRTVTNEPVLRRLGGFGVAGSAMAFVSRDNNGSLTQLHRVRSDTGSVEHTELDTQCAPRVQGSDSVLVAVTLDRPFEVRCYEVSNSA